MRHRETNRSTSPRFSALRLEFSAPYRNSPITGTGSRNSSGDWESSVPVWPASTAIATLVSSATLLPLTEIDAFEFSLNDAPHYLGIVRGDTPGEIGEREWLLI